MLWILWKSTSNPFIRNKIFGDKFVDNLKSYLQFPFFFVEKSLSTCYQQEIHK
jgi:hypothetical protein